MDNYKVNACIISPRARNETEITTVPKGLPYHLPAQVTFPLLPWEAPLYWIFKQILCFPL